MQAIRGNRRIFFEVEEPADSSAAEPRLIICVPREGMPHQYFRPWLSGLSKRYRVAYLDLPGAGPSSRHPGSGYPLSEFVNDVEAVQSALEVERAVVLGHSFGGQVALEYAIAQPSRVSAMVLVGTLYSLADRTGGHAPSYSAEEVKLLNELVALASQALESEGDWEPVGRHPWWTAAMKTQFHGPVPALWSEAMRDFEFGAEAYFFNTGGAALAPERTPLASWDIRPRLNRVKAPTLIIHGDSPAEYSAPLSHARVLHEGIVGSQLAIIPEVGSYPWAEKPEEFCKLVLDFLESA
jgi:pimeloyl-ACP methyl ester carboxylesterase